MSDNKENQTSINSNTADLQGLLPRLTRSESDQCNLEEQTKSVLCSKPLSPSSAVRSIVTNLFQENVVALPCSSKTTKRARIEGKYGEEITSSDRLDILKKKASKRNAKKRQIDSTNETNPTAPVYDGSIITKPVKRARRSTKRNNEFITSSQAISATATLQLYDNTRFTQNSDVSFS